MKNVNKKIILIALIFIVMILLFSKSVLASGGDSIDPYDYKPNAIEEKDSERFTTIAGKLLGAVRNIGVIVSVIIILILGLKYMFGSVEEKVISQKTILPVLVGMILLIAGTTIPQLIFTTFANQ